VHGVDTDRMREEWVFMFGRHAGSVGGCSDERSRQSFVREIPEIQSFLRKRPMRQCSAIQWKTWLAYEKVLAAGARVSGEDAADEDAPAAADGSGGEPSESDNRFDVWHAGHDADADQSSDSSRHAAPSRLHLRRRRRRRR
jgi:hypothetical protein